MTAFFRSIASLVLSNNAIICGFLILEVAKSAYAFSPTIGNGRRCQSRGPSSQRQIHPTLYSTSSHPRPRCTRLNLSSIKTCTELEVLEMKRLVLSISNERDDETRRNYVSKWITRQTERTDYLEGIKMLQLWDTTVIEIGKEFQNKLRKKSRQCPARLSATGGGDLKKKKKENELTLWAFVDMLVQTKTLLNRLEVPKQTDGRYKLHYHRTQQIIDRGNNEDEGAFQ